MTRYEARRLIVCRNALLAGLVLLVAAVAAAQIPIFPRRDPRRDPLVVCYDQAIVTLLDVVAQLTRTLDNTSSEERVERNRATRAALVDMTTRLQQGGAQVLICVPPLAPAGSVR